MKKIAFFCIPAHGHTNPMLPVAAELVRRGNTVRFYSFNEFENKIKATGADFVSCDEFLGELTEKEEAGLKNVSTTEMTIQDIRIALNMDSFLDDEFKTFQPDVVYSDSVCFWGKLNAWKHNVPLVVSTSTFAFNQMASQYMKNSPKELADMIFGLPKISKALKTLEPYGYKVKNALSLVQSDNKTDSVVYTSERFQPYSESFSNHYAFVGPSVFSKVQPDKDKERPLVYISMGTVINDRPDFYAKCIEALKNENLDVIISCGNALDVSVLGELPENIKVYPYVDQLDILSKADAFITHCGMNSVSESLYMATPMVLYPQTGEQQAVARRAKEIGAGVMLANDSVDEIRSAVLEILNNDSYTAGAKECSKDFRSCMGTVGAAEFIETAPHASDGVDILDELNKANGKIQIAYCMVAAALIVLFGLLISWKYVWIIGISAGALSTPITRAIQKKKYYSLVEKSGKVNH
ncbi:MAG TPA: glycosyl transferase [Ruminococcaceae bacterium]|nr:glycosyl transferase [Oscillospiraceae bacterium]